MTAARQEAAADDPSGGIRTEDDVLVVPEATGQVVRAPQGASASQVASASIPWAAAATALIGFRRVAAALIVADACSISAALLLVHAGKVSDDLLITMLVAPVAWVLVFHLFGLYGLRHLSPQEEFRRLISATTLAVVLITVGSVWWDQALDRSTLAKTWLVTLLLELVVRRVARWHIRNGKRSGRMALRTLIVGTNHEAEKIAEALSQPVRGFVPLGYVLSSTAPGEPGGLPVLGSIDHLASTIGKLDAECVIVASSATSSEDVSRISRACRKASIEMRISANTPEVLTSRVSIQQVHTLMMLAVRPVRLSRVESAFKRGFDIILASSALVLVTPFLGMIAVAIRVSSRGPALFRQERVTKGGLSFTMYKFRTMTVPSAEPDGPVFDLTKPFFKMRDDPRLTRLGRTLRSYSLDELPQLWNVVKGDMSLVGPRPLSVEQVRANLELLQPRHEVRAGLTGWWQMSGRSDVGAEEALRMDMFYIENWSLSLDLYVLLKTVGAVIGRRGAY
jgi:exopolysaccharide biosynthesis polyprenyl glycosylphosphotransferase